MRASQTQVGKDATVYVTATLAYGCSAASAAGGELKAAHSGKIR